MRLPKIFARGALMLMSLTQILHNTKSIFCHQVQFYRLKSVITNLGWTRMMHLSNIFTRGALMFCPSLTFA